MIFSTNNQLILSTYKQGQGLQAEVKSGFAVVKQKNHLVGLSLLVEARLEDGSYLPVGSTVYIDEELLMTQPWAKKTKRMPALGDQDFLVVELRHAVAIDTREKANG